MVATEDDATSEMVCSVVLWREDQPGVHVEAARGTACNALLFLLLNGQEEVVIRGDVLKHLHAYYAPAANHEIDQLCRIAATGPFKIQVPTYWTD